MSSETPIDLELVEDDFTEEEHRKMDKEINLIHGLDVRKDPYALFGHFVLHTVKRQLGFRATRDYESVEDFERMIQVNPNLLDMLEKGSLHGFKSVRCLKILRNVILRSESATPQTTTTTVPAAWSLEYRGKHVEIMRDNVNALPRAATHANFIELIQSSGYGKSRMVDELAKLVFTIPLNICDPRGRTERNIYPPLDPVVWQYFSEVAIKERDFAEYFVASFFSNLFLEVASEVERTFSGQKRQPQDDFAQRWREHLLQKLSVSVSKLRPGPSTLRLRLYEIVVLASRKDVIQQPRSKLNEQLRDNLNYLLGVLDAFCVYPPLDEEGKRCIKIMLYLDGAHELARDIGCDKKLFDAVVSILAEFQHHCVFTVFLSTRSSADPEALSTEIVRSSRRHNISVLGGPITEMPFDCHPTFPLQLGQYKLADVAHLEFMMRFGRPLFWTKLEGHSDSSKEEFIFESMINLARRKLLGDDAIYSEPRQVSRYARIAILDVLITIDYEPRQELAHRHEIELVANHMRTAFPASGRHAHLRSGYPSEPFIAEAASRQMHHFRRDSIYMIQDLVDGLDDGLIDPSRKSEVAMRLLLRKAYMNSIVAEQGAEEPNFSLGCHFVRFLGALLAKPFGTEVLRCKPDNITASSNDLEVMFKNSVVRFTHFAKAADSSAMTTRGMTMGFLRGAAIIGRNSSQSVDIAIPILLDKNDKIVEASVSALLIQVKRKHQEGCRTNAHVIDATKLGFFPDEAAGHVRPYVAFVAELGARAPATPGGNVSFGKPLLHAPLRNPAPPPRYSIRARGCTRKTWKAINSEENMYYKKIMASDDLLSDHPRQDEASLQVARQLLPFWSHNPRWFSETADEVVKPVLGDKDEHSKVSEQTDPDESMKID